MTLAPRRRDLLPLALLLALPVLAHAPAWWEGRLLAPGDGAALHFPLRAAVWEAWRHGELPSWNHGIFLGAPLLPSYRPAALHPVMAALSVLPAFAAFQTLVLLSLSLSGVLAFLYVRRLGGERLGAYVAGLSFSLGPYLVGHLSDTATLAAAPMLLLALLALESHLSRASWRRAAGLSAAIALLLLAGSPEAVRAGGALFLGRLLVGLFARSPKGPKLTTTALALLAGLLLSAPQVLPTLLAAREAGRSITGFADTGGELPGATGLLLRYTSHTPAPALALSALPLAASQLPIRALGGGLLISLALQWGRGPLAAPGGLALVFDLTLSILAGLSLSAQWRARQEVLGQRLRAYFLVASVFSAVGLSVAAAALGPLPDALTGGVGILALSLFLYFPNAGAGSPVRAGVFLLPLTVSFLLQPHGRRAWETAPTRLELERGTGTREALDRAMGPRRGEPSLALVHRWPKEEALDLAYANLGPLMGRRSVNGYDPMVPLRTRVALGMMGAGGTLPRSFLAGEPGQLEALGIRFVQVPIASLEVASEAGGWGASLQVPVALGRPRFFAFPPTYAGEVRLVSSLSEATGVPQGETVAVVHVRLVSGRALSFPVRAGVETAEWAHDRADVKAAVAHYRAPVAESWPVAGQGFSGHRYQGAFDLRTRYFLDGVTVERRPGAGSLLVTRVALLDRGRIVPASLDAAYLSDSGRFRELAATTRVRLFELPGSLGPARLVNRLRRVESEQQALEVLSAPAARGFDPHREALWIASDGEGPRLDPGGRLGRADLVRVSRGTIEVRAEGPGLLVVGESFDRGFRAFLDGRAVAVSRVNVVQMGIPLSAGPHRVVLKHRARGFLAGLALAGLAALGLGLALVRQGLTPAKAAC
ncbi:MAG TPA: hypothetical protein VJU18_03925 [Vicinamibacteria bacterium]|nr:hypothetical protein [Vicinamibacteria bacterium]